MPKYILPLNANPLRGYEDSRIINLLKELSTDKDFSRNAALDVSEKWKLAEILQGLRTDGDGEVISLKKALEMISRFSDKPYSYSLSSGLVNNFMQLLDDLRTKVPDADDMGIRLYIGRPSAGSPLQLVVIPMKGPRPATGVPRNRLLEQEKTFFTDSGTTFFGLAVAAQTISNSTTDCKALVAIKDPVVHAIYFSDSAVMDFYSKLPAYHEMVIYFAKTLDADKLTIVIMFFDADGNPVSSQVGPLNQTVTGICFDQGDLIPPPNVVPDSSLA